MKIGKRILELRKKQNITQEQLAEKLDVTRQTISNWELGETSPNSEQLIELADIFEVSVDELLGHKNKYKNNDNKILYTIILVLVISLIILLTLLFNSKESKPINENPLEMTTTQITTSKSKINDTFIRTYKILNVEKVDCKNLTGCDENTYKVTLEQCQKDKATIHITNYKGIKNLEKDKTYEFTFDPNIGEVWYEDKIENIFAFNTIKETKETNKKCNKQTQDKIKTRSN